MLNKTDCGCTEKEEKRITLQEGWKDCGCEVKDLATDCIVYTGDTLEYSRAEKGTQLTEVLAAIDKYAHDFTEQTRPRLSIISEGSGIPIYSGVNGLGDRLIKSLNTSGDLVKAVAENGDIILTIDEDNIASLVKTLSNVEGDLNNLANQKITIKNDFANLTSLYNTLKGNIYLLDKGPLNAAYGDASTGYIKAYNTLLNYIDLVITDRVITDAEKTQLSSYTIAYGLAVVELTRLLKVATLDISKNLSISYTDGATSQLQDAIDAQVIASKAYTDAQAQLAAYESKAYADGILSAQEAELIAQANENLAAAKAYADAQADLAETIAKAYADGIVTAAEARAILDATNKANAAKAYSDASTLLLTQRITAFEDGIVDEIEAIKIFNAENNLAAAKAYVDAQTLAAIESTKAYADGIITAQEQIILDNAAASVAAAKAYSDSQRTLTETVIKAYADGIVDELEARTITATQGAADAAKAYAAAQDALLKTNIQAYADGIVTAEEQARIAQATANVAAAKAYTDAQAEATRVISQAYADGIIDDVEARAITAAQGAVDAAKLYAEAQDALLRTSLLAYADGIVDAEEQARINQANANVAAAKAYAEAQAEATRVIALAYADGVITAEEARAIADANAKLAEAKAYAQSLVDGLVTDVNTALAQAANAVSTANAAARATNFLTTTVDGNVISTGTLQVGSVTGANAGISGVEDETDGNSVRFWAGATYANRKKANWLIKDNGTEEQWLNGSYLIRRRGALNGNYFDELYNVNGTLAKRTALVNGKIVEEWYNDGVLIYEIGQGGIIYVTNVPEKYTPAGVYQFTNTSNGTDFSGLITEARGKIVAVTSGSGTATGPGQAGDGRRYELRRNKSAFIYSAGQNPNSEANKQYEGYKNTQLKTDSVADGWYADEQLGDMLTYFNDEGLKLLGVYKLVSGKVVQDQMIQVRVY